MFAWTRKCLKILVWSFVLFLFSTRASLALTIRPISPTEGQEQAYFFYQRSEYPRDCAEVSRRCPSENGSSVHVIKPDGYPAVFDAHCGSDGYTVIARRLHGMMTFNRSWEDYSAGFGFLSNEFWIGNQRLSYLTNQKRYELVIDVTLHDGSTFSATYNEFRISDARSNYALITTGQFTGDPRYCYWGPWTPCPVSCGDGVRTRYCRCTDGVACVGDTVEETVCRVKCSAVSDCQEIYDSGRRSSGLYDINPAWSQDPIQVYCNMSDGGGWTVIQRHFLSSSRQDFHQNWNAYKNGFGSPSEQFWIGNERLFGLTNQGEYELRIDMVNTNHNSYYAQYDFFRISGENNKYQLIRLGTFSGTAGHDALKSPRRSPADRNIENMYFTTYDRDNDRESGNNCAYYNSNYRNGGWWHNNCYSFSPNYGKNFYSTRVGYWHTSSDWDYLIYTEMKIRPRGAN